MKLEKLVIKNFRGISDATIDFENFTTLVGPNNIGKSTILQAINLVLDNKKPCKEDWPGRQPTYESMEIICEFGQLEEWETKKPAISQLLFGDKLKIKMEAAWNSDQSSYDYEYYVYNKETKYPWTGLNYTAATKDSICKKLLIDVGITKSSEYNDLEKIKKLEEFVHENNPELIQEHEGWNIKKFANSLQQAVPHVMYVPASFKIEDELKTTNSSSPFSFLFTKKLFPKVKEDQSYIDYMQKADALQKKLKGNNSAHGPILGLAEDLNQVSSTLNEILDFDSKVRLFIGEIDVEPLFMKAATFLIDEELETNLNYQGSGVQRALAFAILESNAEVESSVLGEQRTVIVLYEEPELYIHPHLMRRLKNTLQKRASSPKWQVICSTHSPFLIDIAENPKSLKLIKRDKSSNKRVVYQVTKEIFEVDNEYSERAALRAALDFHPVVCESFFAKRVVIVEGDTEVAVFGMAENLIQKLGISGSLHKDTTLISAGGKWTIPAIIRVLNSLSIEYYVIHDQDRKGLTDEELDKKLPIHPFKANKKIAGLAPKDKVFVVDDTFENILWGTSTDDLKSSDKPYNSWKRVKDYTDGKIDLSDECKTTLKKILEFAFVQS